MLVQPSIVSSATSSIGGEVVHWETPGGHKAIVDEELWNAVQAEPDHDK
jgi:hypothetical protein